MTEKRVNRTVKVIKETYWKKLSADIEHDLYGGQRKIWNMLKNWKKPVNEYLQFSKISINEWEKHFEELFENQKINQDQLEDTGNMTTNEYGK